MRLKSIYIKNFRNIEFLKLSFNKKHQFFLGNNAQGKTSLLEAIHLITNLRSFRTTQLSALIKHKQNLAQIFYQIDHQSEGYSDILISFSSSNKSVEINNKTISKYSDFIGRFPSIILSSEDIQLLRSSPTNRRRFLNITLASLDPQYYSALKSYHQAILHRNALLKHNQQPKLSVIDPFDQILSQEAHKLFLKRIDYINKINKHFSTIFNFICPNNPTPKIHYKPDTLIQDSKDFYKLLKESLSKDLIFKATQKGPHRDDFTFEIDSKKNAKLYASEGQQNTLILSLKLAQKEIIQQTLNITPTILADDILGHLDDDKKEKFWEFIQYSNQIIATGTSLPKTLNNNWEIFNIESGMTTQRE